MMRAAPPGIDVTGHPICIELEKKKNVKDQLTLAIYEIFNQAVVINIRKTPTLKQIDAKRR